MKYSIPYYFHRPYPWLPEIRNKVHLLSDAMKHHQGTWQGWDTVGKGEMNYSNYCQDRLKGKIWMTK